MGEPLLRCEGLGLSRGGAIDLASVSFSVERGSLTGLVGPDRWDKDALAAVLRGDRRPTRGTVRLAGRSITAMPPARRVRQGLAWTLTPPVEPAASTLANAIIIAATATRRPSPLDFLRRRPSRSAVAAAAAILATTGLAARSGCCPGSLEAAERARLDVARALAARPHLLLVDRLTSLVPPTDRDGLALLLRDVVASGTTVLWIEDDALLAADHADRVVALHHGRTIAGGPCTPANDEAIEHAFLGVAR